MPGSPDTGINIARQLDPSTVRSVLLADGEWHNVAGGRFEYVAPVLLGAGPAELCFVALSSVVTGELVIPFGHIRGWVVPRTD